MRVDQIRGLPFVTRNDFARLCLATEARAQTLTTYLRIVELPTFLSWTQCVGETAGLSR